MSMNRRARRIVIISGGQIDDYSWYKDFWLREDLIICADSGVDHARKLGVVPYLIVGDLDSATQDSLQYFQQLGSKIIAYNPEKSQTDTQIALEYALERNPDEIVFLAATGDRLDHTWSNILLLTSLIEKQIKAVIVRKAEELSLITDRVEIKGQIGEIVSLLPITPKVTGIKTKGLKYSVPGGFFTISNPYGVSNEMIEKDASIEIEEGILLMIRRRQHEL